MQVLKIEHNGKEYTRKWEMEQKTVPENIDELCFFLILSNNFFDVKKFIQSRTEILQINENALAQNMKYFTENKVTKITFLGKKVGISAYEKHILADNENIKKQIEFATQNYDNIKLILSF